MKLEEITASGAFKLGFDLTDQHLLKFRRYYQLLVEWNKKINLTAIISEKEVAEKHFLDSLTIATSKLFLDKCKLVDVGTGAGFPGLPLKIVFPELELSLVDSLRKRIGFLNFLIDELGLKGAKVYWSRAEEFGRDQSHREKYDFCTIRAVAQLPVLLEYCLPLLKTGGILIAQKGEQCDEEVKNSANALSVLGGEVVDLETIRLPHSGFLRKLISIEKKHSTSPNYPRRSGIPAKRPL